MFNRISPWYDLLNHTLSLGLDFYWRKKLLQTVRLQTSGRVLDLAAGTMDVSRQLQKQGRCSGILAMDFSRPMLEKGRKKIDPDHVLPLAADARDIPLPEASVDCVTIAFGIRNILPREKAYAEIFRILTPGGRLCILEFGSGRQKIWGGIYNLYLQRILPGIGRLVSRDRSAYGYLAETIREFPTAEDLKKELLESGFRRAEHRSLTSGIVCLHIADK
ncbi:MAG: ubiquinone/menaquinone biosynthesis methyltransferase [Desulfohalobiaceae bacterium]|nr:ubiquinone/menaquinone biosynthesis methyltransferase [Desulfohalobiaceae bacterium]